MTKKKSSRSGKAGKSNHGDDHHLDNKSAPHPDEPSTSTSAAAAGDVIPSSSSAKEAALKAQPIPNGASITASAAPTPAPAPTPAQAAPTPAPAPASTPAKTSSPAAAPASSEAPKKVTPPKQPTGSSSSASAASNAPGLLSRIFWMLYPVRLVSLCWRLALFGIWIFLWPRPIKFMAKSLVMFGVLFLACLYGLIRGILRPADRRNLNYFAAQFFAQVTSFLEITHSIEGAEHLKNQPCVYVLNHQSTLDLLSVAHIMPMNTFIIGKKSLLYVPILGWYAKISHNILIDRQNHESAMKTLEKVGRELRDEKASVLVFPEGTRSRSDGTLLPFKKGGFNLAVGGQVPIVPVVISNQRPVYNSKKWSFPGGEIKVTVLPPISTEGLTRDDVPQLAEKVREFMAQALERSEPQASS